MTSKIGGYDNRPVSLSTGAPVQRTRNGEDTAKPSTASTATDPIRITDEARQLGALEQAIGQAPAFDELRVNSLRQSIEDGTYQISPERIADRLLKTEFDLRA